MPAVQSSYSEYMSVGRVGQVVNTESSLQISRNVEDAALAFGAPVVQGSADSGVRLVATGDTEVFGISVRERSTLADNFPVGHSARIMTKGVIWGTASVAVSAGDPVHVVADGGAFTNTGGIEIVGARYDSSAAVGELAKIRMA